ncbi:MAG: TIGR01459 family HAD-type hydrolase [Pseudomonadota bacterium]
MADARPSRLTGLGEVMDRYTVILSDIWGVLHNGLQAWQEAVDALQQARADGKTVILISNAPRPSDPVIAQLQGLGVPRSAFDAIITSGDVTRSLLEGRFKGASVSHIGPDKDKPLVDGLPVTFTADQRAEVCLCSGLNDDQTETPEDYRPRLQALVDRGVPMICANPDKVVELGNRLMYCAGALADLYEEMGGETIVLGKPHAPIYEAALSLAGGPPVAECLALGDSVRTDLRGAADQGIDCVFVTGGIHASEFGPSLMPNAARVEAFLAEAPYPAIGWMHRLSW